jgi:hypothetical protein
MLPINRPQQESIMSNKTYVWLVWSVPFLIVAYLVLNLWFFLYDLDTILGAFPQ